jgi:hypothetical protein
MVPCLLPAHHPEVGSVIEIYETGPMGETSCALCKRLVYIAWDDEMNRVALDPDNDGPIAVSLDGNRLPWCRDAIGSQLAFDDAFYRLHEPHCTGLATVTPIGRARSARRRAAQTAPARRTAHAR